MTIALAMPSWPPIPPQCPAPLKEALTTLETTLVESKQDRILLHLPTFTAQQLQQLCQLCVDRLLRFEYRRVLVLVPSKQKQVFLDAWAAATSLQDGRRLSDCFQMVTTPQQAQLCITTIQDLQRKDFRQAHRFFSAFDAVVLFDVADAPGPGWHQIMERFTARWIGLSRSPVPQDTSVFGIVVTPEERTSR